MKQIRRITAAATLLGILGLGVGMAAPAGAAQASHTGDCRYANDQTMTNTNYTSDVSVTVTCPSVP